MLCRVPCGGGGGGGGGAESFALSCSPKHVRAPIVLPRSHNGQAGNLQHDRRRGHRRRPHGPHDVAILLYDPPVLSPRSPPSLCAACGTCGPAGAKQLARERESSTAGSEALRCQRSRTQSLLFFVYWAPCCRWFLTLWSSPLPPPPAGVPQPTRGKTASSHPLLANGSASTRACRRLRAPRTKARARPASLRGGDCRAHWRW